MLGALEVNKKDFSQMKFTDKIPAINGESDFVHTLNVNILSALANDPSKINSKSEAVLIKPDCSMTPSNIQQEKEEKHATETDCCRNEPNEAHQGVMTVSKCPFTSTETEDQVKGAPSIDFTKPNVIPKTEPSKAPNHQNLGHVEITSAFEGTITSEQSVPSEVTSNLSLVKTDDTSLSSTISQQSLEVKYGQSGLKISRLKVPLKTAIILFGCCEVQLRRCDHLVRKINHSPDLEHSKVEIRRGKKPGPKSKTVRTEGEVRESSNAIMEKVSFNLYTKADKKSSKSSANKISPSSEKRRMNLKKTTHLGLASRMRVHSDNKPYKCTLCVLGFANSRNRRRHMRIKHPNVMPPAVTGLKCSSCGKRFMSRVDLKSHLVQHADVKLYDCNLCGSRFTRRANLSRHKRDSCRAKDQLDTSDKLGKV